jgi:hypothetical protein
VHFLGGTRGQREQLVGANLSVPLYICGRKVSRRWRHVNPVTLCIDTAYLHRVIAAGNLLFDGRRQKTKGQTNAILVAAIRPRGVKDTPVVQGQLTGAQHHFNGLLLIDVCGDLLTA